MKLLIDSYAWIEYLEGSEAGLKVKKFLEEKNDIFTITLTVAEVISRAARLKRDTDTAYKAITYNSNIIEITTEIAKEAGLVHAEIRKKIKNFGLVDSLLLVVANKINAKILTGDPHFKGMKNIIFI